MFIKKRKTNSKAYFKQLKDSRLGEAGMTTLRKGKSRRHKVT